MDRAEAKRKISVLLSDLGLLGKGGKMPEGRTDLLADEYESAPEFWKAAVERMPPKGSRDWRWAKEYAVTGAVPKRKPRATKVKQAPLMAAEEPVEEGTCVICDNEGAGHEPPCIYAGQE